jgi:hypothetical protein
VNEQFSIARRPVTPEYVLEVLRDSYGQQCEYDPEAEPGIVLSFDTTVAEWRQACDLLPWRGIADAFNVELGIHCSREQWKAALEPAKRKPLRDVCSLLARHAELPQACPVTVLGSSCLSAGTFFAVRSLLRKAGADVAEIAPSTPLESYTRQHPEVFLGPISRLAPGALPPVKIHHPTYDAAVWGCAAGLLLMMIGACVTFLWVIVVGAFVFIASYATTWIAAGCGPSRVELGDLKTFRDLATALAQKGTPAVSVDTTTTRP